MQLTLLVLVSQPVGSSLRLRMGVAFDKEQKNKNRLNEEKAFWTKETNVLNSCVKLWVEAEFSGEKAFTNSHSPDPVTYSIWFGTPTGGVSSRHATCGAHSLIKIVVKLGTCARALWLIDFQGAQSVVCFASLELCAVSFVLLFSVIYLP